MANLVAVILTYNEAHHIETCVAALRDWVDAVVVWDSGSTDDTTQRAAAAGALVVQRPFDNYAAQRQAALDSTAAEWIFFVDADERATPALAAEVRQVITAPDAAAGYWTPRRNFIVGHEMRAGGFSPDYQLRLLRRSAANYDPNRQVHEIVALRGPAGYLVHPLIHYNYQSWAQFHRKQRVYAAYEARILAERGIRPRPHNFILQPMREFYRRFITLQGWRDGWQGAWMAFWLAWYYGLLPYAILWRQQRSAE
ncbi:MAG TPA: glycosyltransferase family 2 protein [Chloroflexi bacterium]|nr:glycosyltransferase family 2 protein [Chloroflexota bacterium]